MVPVIVTVTAIITDTVIVLVVVGMVTVEPKRGHGVTTESKTEQQQTNIETTTKQQHTTIEITIETTTTNN